MDGCITILDKNLDSQLTIDHYKSFIWAERYNINGDFEVYIPIDGSYVTNQLLRIDENKKSIWMNCYASIKDSKNLMFLEQFRVTNDEESGVILIITGRSLETILMRRIVWGLKVINGNLQNSIKNLLEECIINPSDPNRRIDNFIFVESSDPKITELTLKAQYMGDNLYDVISGICTDKKIGFKIELNDNNQFEFSLYSGTDRSYDQEDNAYVIFSKKSENLLNSEYLESDAFMKNVTLIGGEGEGVDRKYIDFGSGEGLDRREIFTDAKDISSKTGDFVLLTSKPSDWDNHWTYYYINNGTEEDPDYEQLTGNSAPTWVSNTYYKYDDEIILSDEEYNELLLQRGRKTIDENKSIQAFNGSIDPFTMYIFGRDFFIGDIVEIEDGYGHHSKTRVTEIVRAIDETGFSTYPTFSLVEEENDDDN